MRDRIMRMATITLLQIQKKNKERVNVFLDGEYAFAVGLARAEMLVKGQELSAQEVATLRAEGDADLAYHRSLRYLSRRPRSRREMADYLTRHGHDEDTVEATLRRLEDRQYVDDDAFAAYWVEQRNRFRPRGMRALRHELRQKGVERDVIEETLEEQDESSAAWAALQPRLGRGFGTEEREYIQKAMAFLARRGFGYQEARAAAERAWARQADAENDEDDEDWELEEDV